MFVARQKSAYCIDWSNARLINILCPFFHSNHLYYSQSAASATHNRTHIYSHVAHSRTFKEPNSSSSDSEESVHQMNCAIQSEKHYVNDFVSRIEKIVVTVRIDIFYAYWCAYDWSGRQDETMSKNKNERQPNEI